MILPVTFKDKHAGFTLIELLIVIGITLVLATAAIPIYGNLQVSAQLNENTSQIVQTVRIARGRSVARLNNTSHGVYFEINSAANDRFILYQGDSYVGRDELYDRVAILDPALSLSTTLSGNEVNFSRGLGIPNTTGTVTLKHDVVGIKTMSINVFGIVEEE